MGQYHKLVNLDKREFVMPHGVGDGLKLCEQVYSSGGVATALVILAACSNGRGGGDLPEDALVGRWAGDRIAIIGDYAEDDDLSGRYGVEDPPASMIYQLCRDADSQQELAEYDAERYHQLLKIGFFTDITATVRTYLASALGFTFSGSGWLDRTSPYGDGARVTAPDMVISLGGA